MSNSTIVDFLIDEDNIEKFWSHGLTALDILQVLEHPFRVKTNRKNRRATYLVIGRNHRGHCLAAPVEPTHDPQMWRLVTA